MICVVCSRTKAPRGRDVPVAMAQDYCDPDCEGYWADPQPGGYWPGELDRLCVCGHRYGVHIDREPSPCEHLTGDRLNPFCPCEAFTPTTKDPG